MTHLVLTIIFTLWLIPQQPADASVRFNRAVTLQQQGKLTEAVDEYRALLRIRPDYAEAHANLGVVLARLEKYDEAIASYESALRLNPQLTPVLLNLGILYYRAGQFERAIEALGRFLAVTPGNTQARQLIGLSLVELGRDEEAIRQLELTLTAAPDDAAVIYSLGLAWLRLNRPELPWAIDRLASLPAGVAASHQLKGLLFFARLEFEKALAELVEARKLNAELPRLSYSFGLCYSKLGRNKEAIAAFEDELKRKPRDITSMYYLASLHEAAANPDLARKYLDEVLRADPQLPEANALLGKILVRQNKPAEALKPLEIAVAKDATDPEKRYLLARVYQQLGRREDAAREFAEVQRLKAEKLRQDRANTPKP
ncbi:MAG TPA: tetratricopeptide repeat protein [Blastocatellia bacterium]|nr:tetratricopeptide repeat protein [Blastocatellia bacterium]